MILHIDIETFSSVELKKSGLYKYCASPDFEILLIAYAIGDMPVQCIDLASGESINEHAYFKGMLTDPLVEKHAHNAAFERNCFKAYGIDVPISQWRCSMVKSAYCGLPMSLKGVSEALKLGDKAKDTAGTLLIKYFSCEVKPTKANGFRTRNLPEHNPAKWAQYKSYCMQDVEAEREVGKRLEKYELPEFELINYQLDQEINDRGILIDTDFAKAAIEVDETFSACLETKVRDLTKVDNPNSAAQLKKWLSDEMDEDVNSLNKESMPELIERAGGAALEVLKLRGQLAKSSIKKYTAMLDCAGEDKRARGLFQFYGAHSGRWSGRLIQLQNLPRNYFKNLDELRELVFDYDSLTLMYDNVPDILSQLIRTAFVPKLGNSFVVADFSAIEARVIAWLAQEEWRLEIFRTHGKIYEASASMMFNVPIEKIDKKSPLRQQGKTAELALGYQGGVDALTRMDYNNEIEDKDKPRIVKLWRAKSPKIVQFWQDVQDYAIEAIKKRKSLRLRNLVFSCDGEALMIQLPSGRKLFYREPAISKNRWGGESLKYKGVTDKNQWGYIETYGGRLVENIVQAVSRDLLAYTMDEIDNLSYDIVMHVHDEIVCESIRPEGCLKTMLEIMKNVPDWAKGLPMKGEGFITNYYKKD